MFSTLAYPPRIQRLFIVAKFIFSAGLNLALSIYRLFSIFFVVAQFRKDSGLPVSTVN